MTGPLVAACKQLLKDRQISEPATLQHLMADVVLHLAIGESRARKEGSADRVRSALDRVRSALPAAFVLGQQHDAHEVLVTLHDTEIFECFLRTETSQLACAQCAHQWDAASGIVTESILQLTLPQTVNLRKLNIMHDRPYQYIWSLREWVKAYFQQEEGIEVTCPSCGEAGSNSQRRRLKSAPEFLCIQLLYFDTGARSGAFASIKPARKWNDFEILDLEICTQDSDGEEGPAAIVRYRIYGIIFHHGPNCTGGHYTFAGCASGCAGRGKCDGQMIKEGRATECEASWYHWDDKNVYGPYTRDRACAAASCKNYDGGKPAVLGEGKHSPYLLFYTRVADPSLGFQPSVPDCALCTHGHEWRSALEEHQ
jgi:hypothetical protein